MITNKTMKYINVSEETLEIPSFGKVNPGETIETTNMVADSRLSIVIEDVKPVKSKR